MKRILVIEDSPEIVSLIRQAFSVMQWETHAALRGPEGLALAQSHNFDLILCDIGLPGMNGYDILKQLRSNPTTATVPFVFLSGQVDRPHVRQGMELGADDYIEKPFMIPELIRAVEVRLQKQEELQKRAEQRLGELRTSLSLALPHELVTPLNSIMGFSSLLLDGTLPASEVQECARHIHDAASRLQRLVENFLYYAQLEVAASDPAKAAEFRKAEVAEIGEAVENIATRTASMRNRVNDLHLQISNCSARISGTHLRSLIQELIDNAFKFSLPGQAVTVTFAGNEGYCELIVSDKGRGMSAEQLQSVGAHVQFDRKRLEQQGSGLGLAIARRLAQLHKGTLWIDSRPNEGTTVRVRLPQGT